MDSWFSVVLSEEEFVGKYKKDAGDAGALNIWLWDYERVFKCSIDLGIAGTIGMEMSREDFGLMLVELINSPKATRTVLAKSESGLNFKSVMKVGFASFSWTFVMDCLSSTRAKAFVKEFVGDLGWQSKLPTHPINGIHPLDAIQIVDDVPLVEPREAQEIIEEHVNATTPISATRASSSSQDAPSDTTLDILMELKDEAASVQPAKKEETLTKPTVTPSSKEAQRRKELEELTAAKVKKPRRFI